MHGFMGRQGPCVTTYWTHRCKYILRIDPWEVHTAQCKKCKKKKEPATEVVRRATHALKIPKGAPTKGAWQNAVAGVAGSWAMQDAHLHAHGACCHMQVGMGAAIAIHASWWYERRSMFFSTLALCIARRTPPSVHGSCGCGNSYRHMKMSMRSTLKHNASRQSAP